MLVGRDDLMALADRRLVTAARGSGQLLLLAGEAGIGKTRLLTQIIARAIDLGFSVHSAGAYPRDHEVAGGLLADLAADLTRSPETSAIGAGLARRLGDIGRTTHPLPPADPADGDAHRLRRILITDLADAICSLGAAAGPVMITLEDLHWADDSTLAVLERIGRQLPSLPMVVVCTFRSDELYPRLPLRDWRTRLLTQRLAEEVRLTRLSPQDTAVMSAAISGIVLPEDVTDGLYARSDGIPCTSRNSWRPSPDPVRRRRFRTPSRTRCGPRPAAQPARARVGRRRQRHRTIVRRRSSRRSPTATRRPSTTGCGS